MTKLECQCIATIRVGGMALASGVARNGMDEEKCCKGRMENEIIPALHGSALDETGYRRLESTRGRPMRGRDSRVKPGSASHS